MTGNLAQSTPSPQEEMNLLARVTKVLPNEHGRRRPQVSYDAKLAAGDPFASTMAPVAPSTAIEGILRFLKLHASCHGLSLDTPALPRIGGYRAVVACRCGDTIEYWLDDATVPRHHLVATLCARQAA